MTPEQHLAQERFNQKYITSTEIINRLQVSRPAIHFRRKAGLLPNVITIAGNNIALWEREFIEPYIQLWETQINSRKNKTDEQSGETVLAPDSI